MSSVNIAAGLWGGSKTVAITGHTRHRHTPSPVVPGFKAPGLPPDLSFGPTALAAAIARTATLRNAPVELLSRWRDSALLEVELMIGNGATFSLSSHFGFLADVERTVFAARVGAGITDIAMNSLGYTWRDNADCLSVSLDPRADFIYAGGNASGYGVVLAEAHGSFSPSISNASIGGRATRKYLRQVKPYIAVNSLHGRVIHGYSVAFGSKPGTSDTFLNLAETQIRVPPLKPASQTLAEETRTVHRIPSSLALATYRSNFVLMDALPVVQWIDWARGRAESPEETTAVEFLRLEYAGRSFLACEDSIFPVRKTPVWIEDFREHPRWWRHLEEMWYAGQHGIGQFAGWFVMEERACERFLDTLSRMIGGTEPDIPEQLELPSIDPVGFGLEGETKSFRGSNSDYNYALFRDGLALLGTPPRRIAGYRRWLPKAGLR